MTDTANLALPCIEGSQAQKHVTHNEALRLLDTLVQLAVLDRDLTAPPGAPSEGQRWIVKTGATGAWASHVDAIAAWQDGAWQFSTPRVGWLAYVIDESVLLTWNGSAWVSALSALSPTVLNNLTLLGVGTTADATNPISAKLNNALFTAKTVAEGGDGDLRYKLSKESAAKTLSFLFQDNYSGRAEIGLTGDDDFHFKVSPDGTTWYESIKIAAANGKVSFPSGLAAGREVLIANRTYYVRADGSDSNTGLVDTSGSAFLTIQKAVNSVAALDLSIYNVIIQVGAGTYTGSTIIAKPFTGAGTVTISGDTTTPSNVLISTSGVGITAREYAQVSIQGMKFVSSGAQGIKADSNAVLTVSGKVEFGACAGSQVYTTTDGKILFTTGSYLISGGAAAHWQSSGKSTIQAQSMTIALSSTPAYSIAFAYANALAYQIINANTFTGTGATGLRFVAQSAALIDSQGSGPTYLPGNASGATSTNGQYL